MEFCDKCGSLMVVQKKRKHSYLVCRKCGKKKLLAKEKVVISERIVEPKKAVVVMGKGEELAELPKTKIMCPKCEHNEAYWWMQQTRAADEPPTIFYRCCKCGYSWRSYS